MNTENNYKMIRIGGEQKAIKQLRAYVQLRQEDGARLDLEEVTEEEIEPIPRAHIHEYLEEKTGTGQALAALMNALQSEHGEKDLLSRVRQYRMRKQRAKTL
jgi:hypothetical protein